MLLTVFVLALIFGVVRPILHTITILFVIDPLYLIMMSYIANVISTVDVVVDALAIGFVVLPITLVDVTVSVYQFTLTEAPIRHPLTGVHGSIGPCLRSLTISLTIHPVSIVHSTRLQPDWLLYGVNFGTSFLCLSVVLTSVIMIYWSWAATF